MMLKDPQQPTRTQPLGGESRVLDMEGRDLCEALASFFEDHFRGRIRFRISGSTQGRYRLTTSAVATLLCHILGATEEDGALVAEVHTDSYTMYLSLAGSETLRMRAHTRRALLLEAREASIDMMVEPSCIELRFPACPATFALRHPQGMSARACLLSALQAALRAMPSVEADGHGESDRS